MSLLKITGLAILCHVLSFGIIFLQIAVTAATMGFAGLILEVPLHLVPVGLLFLLGLTRKSRDLMLVLPTYFIMWSAPAMLHRLSISSEFNSINEEVGIKAFQTELPNQITLLQESTTLYGETQTLLYSGAIEELVVAGHSWRNVNSPSVYNPETKTLNLKHLVFSSHSRKVLSECELKAVFASILLEDYGDPTCVHVDENTKEIPEHVVFTYTENEDRLRTTHTLIGKISANSTNGKYDFEELERHTQRQKRFRSISLLPGAGWSSILREDKGLWTFQAGPIVVLEAGTSEDIGLDLIMNAYGARGVSAKHAVRNHKTYYNLVKSLNDRSAIEDPDERLNKVLQGATRQSILARLAEIDRALPTHAKYPDISRKYGLRHFRNFAGFLCVNGAVNETTAFILGSSPGENGVSKDCRYNINNETVSAEFQRGEIAMSNDRTRREDRSRMFDAVIAEFEMMRTERVKLDTGDVRFTLKPIWSQDAILLELFALRNGDAFGEVDAVGIKRSSEEPVLFSGAKFNENPAGYIEVFDNQHGGTFTAILAPQDIMNLRAGLTSSPLSLFIDFGRETEEFELSPDQISQIAAFLEKLKSVETLKSEEMQYAVPFANW